MPLLAKATPVIRGARDLIERVKDLEDHGVESGNEREELRQLLKDEDFLKWVERAWGPDTRAEITKYRIAIRLVTAVEDLEDFLAELTQGLAPTHFEFKGFRVENPDRIAERRALALLDGVSFLIELFKKRGMEKMLRAGISKIVLNAEDDSVAHGRYFENTQEVHLMPRAVEVGGRLWRNWVQEVFLHEFGHHVHLRYMPAQAREHWNSAWAPIKDLEQTYHGKNYNVSYTVEDRRRYYKTLSQMDWNPSKAARKFRDLDKVKFGEWLRSYGVNGPLIAEKSFRPTKHGQRIFGQLNGKFPVDDYDALIKRVRSNLYLDDGMVMNIPFNIVTELAAKDREIGDKAIEEAKAELEIPTGYGKTNEKEDFAETWVAFMVNPNALSPRAKLRMQQTLALSGLYGKEVLRLSHRVALRYLELSSLSRLP